MKFFDAGAVAEGLPYRALVDHLRDAFQAPAEAPVRECFDMSTEAHPRELLVMPAWDPDTVAVKLVSIFPDNVAVGIPTLNGIVVLFDGEDGQVRAVIDAGELTARRTACASALASSYLSREGSKHHLIVGTGRLVPYFAAAHRAVRDIECITVCGRNAEKAQAAASHIEEETQVPAHAIGLEDLEAGMSDADIISTLTGATTPLVKGDWLTPGQHLDLVGGYRPDMREVDDLAIAKASIFVDTREGVLAEAGDLLQPLESGLIERSDILADLHELCSDERPGRISDTKVTLFKSVGTALEDLAAARLLIR